MGLMVWPGRATISSPYSGTIIQARRWFRGIKRRRMGQNLYRGDGYERDSAPVEKDRGQGEAKALPLKASPHPGAPGFGPGQLLFHHPRPPLSEARCSRCYPLLRLSSLLRWNPRWAPAPCPVPRVNPRPLPLCPPILPPGGPSPSPVPWRVL